MAGAFSCFVQALAQTRRRAPRYSPKFFQWLGGACRSFVLPCVLSTFATIADALPVGSSVPGGVALVKLGTVSDWPDAPLARLDEQAVWVTRDSGYWIAVIGLSLDQPARMQELVVRSGDEQKVVRFDVGPKHYREQRITLRNAGQVALSPSDERRALAEIAQIQSIKRYWRTSDATDGNFVLPAQGRLSSGFGMRRFFNGEARSPHNGLDLAVPRGTPVTADAAGEVLAVGDYFFNGKTLFLDHGNGLISMFCHLDRIEVRAGDVVAQGKRIGLSGMTGRASGPHLHWSVILNGTMVDPALFVNRRRLTSFPDR